MDIVYGIPTDILTIASPLNSELNIYAVTMENIIADKLSAAHEFKSGNSRMKDFDDLWRISQIKPNSIKWDILGKILSSRQIPSCLDLNWINPGMEKLWKSHVKRNKDLPQEFELILDDINEWIKSNCI